MSVNREFAWLESVVKNYGKEKVVEVEDLHFYLDERVSICGKNGSGKSTLLRLIAGISSPDTGRVYRSQDLASNVIGYVPQAGGIYVHLSITQNILIRRQLYGLHLRIGSYLAIAEKLGLDRFMDRRIIELSGGYQRLAAIVIALSSEPQSLLLDEPFSGLDLVKRDTLEEVLLELSSTLRVLIIAAPSLADTLPSDRTIIMEGGRATWSV